jgi:AraC-like DNA-binding protein
MKLFGREHAFDFHAVTTNKSARETSYAVPALEVSLILEGKLTFLVDGRKRMIEGPCATFQAYRKSLRVIAPAGRQIRTMWCHVPSEELSNAQWQSVKQLAPVQPIRPLLTALFSNALSLPGDGGRPAELLELDQQLRDALGAAIFSEYMRGARGSALTKLPPPAVLIAKRALDKDYAKTWTVESLASVAGGNPHYLIHLFKAHLGESPIRYLWNRRVEAGVHLLQTTALTIDEIAYRCGFQSSAHFSRRVKERQGAPPSLLREKSWGRANDLSAHGTNHGS